MFDLSQTQLARFYNKSSEQIPAFGVMLAARERDFWTASLPWSVKSPTRTGVQYRHFINGRLPVDEGGVRPVFAAGLSRVGCLRGGDSSGRVVRPSGRFV